VAYVPSALIDQVDFNLGQAAMPCLFEVSHTEMPVSGGHRDSSGCLLTVFDAF
jgi:hypothetical protein